jgi:hypothetical protein
MRLKKGDAPTKLGLIINPSAVEVRFLLRDPFWKRTHFGKSFAILGWNGVGDQSNLLFKVVQRSGFWLEL